MKRRIISFVLLSLVFTIQAQDVSFEEAQNAARSFLYQRDKQAPVKSAKEITLSHIETITRPSSLKSTGEKAFFYVFKTSTKGFIIATADKNLPPVLGYSFENNYSNSFGNESLTDLMNAWMDNFEEYCRDTEKTAVNRKQWDQLLSGRILEMEEATVPPLLGDIMWNQGCLYNEMCPEDEEGPCGHVYAGCVATAMGQIMKYWGYPEQGQGQFTYTSYSHPEYGELSVDFSAAHYNWDLMPNTLDDNSSQEEINEIAKLLFHCGVANNMHYSAYGSSSGCPIEIWNKYFNYSPEVYYLRTRPYLPFGYDDEIRFELDHNCPIIFLTGHAYVCDGYEGEYFHLNWGWDGINNGNYLLAEKYPYGMEIAAGISPYVRNIPCEEQDSLALVDLYNQTNGSEWYNNENWLTGPVSSWYGIKLVAGRVNEIYLPWNNLRGNLPTSIGNLSGLSFLMLNNNGLIGEIPASISGMVRMQSFKASSNDLSGNIPQAIGQCISLTDLCLNNNQLSGSIPHEMGNLKICISMNLSYNNLEGPLPDSLGMFEKISYFNVEHNNLTGSIPDSFCTYENLYFLDISENDLSGDLPDLSKTKLCHYDDNGLKLENNHFGFKNIQSGGITDFNHLWYSPQKEISCSPDHYVTKTGESLSIDIRDICDVGHPDNVYTWYKDEEYINSGAILEIPDVQISNSGNYNCMITNTAYPDLQLSTSLLYITSEEDLSGYQLSITTNPAGTTFTLNGTEYKDDDEDGQIIIDGLMPGTYTYSLEKEKHISLEDILIISNQNLSLSLNLVRINHAPIVNAGENITAMEGDTLNIDASLSEDPDGDELFFHWSASENFRINSPDNAETKIILPFVEKDSTTYVHLEVSDGLITSKDSLIIIILNKALLVENSWIQELQIFPNPCSSEVHLKWNSEGKDTWIQLYDLLGKKQYSQIFSGEEANISTRNFPKGIYILQIRRENEIFSRKLVVE